MTKENRLKHGKILFERGDTKHPHAVEYAATVEVEPVSKPKKKRGK